MTAPMFADASDLNDFLGSTIPTARANAVLADATALFQDLTNQNLFFVADDIVVLNPSPDGYVLLPELPVTDVSLFEYLDYESNEWVTIDPSIYRWDSSGKVYVFKHQESWPWQWGTTRVTYSHGYEVIPYAVQAFTLRQAARSLANPYDVLQDTVGGVSVRFKMATKSGATDFGAADASTIGRYSKIEVY